MGRTGAGDLAVEGRSGQLAELLECWRWGYEIPVRRPSRCDEKWGDSLGKFLANVAEHESEPRGVSGWRSSVYPTRTAGGWGVVGSGQLPGLGAATAVVAKVARAAVKRVKNCIMMVRVSGSDVWRTSGCGMGSYRRNRGPFIPGCTRAKALNLGLQDPRAV